MVTTGMLLGRINPYNNRKKILVENQSTNDIIQSILDNHKKYINEYKNISSFFRGSNNYETGKNIYNYLKKNISYKIDSADRQLIKSPAAILATKEADCKMYSNFAAGILDNLKIPFVYRFAGYSAFDNQPAHVFVVINPNTKKEIWLDPVLRQYDYKKPYNFKIDKKMAVIAVSGIGKAGKGKAKVKNFLKKGAKVIVKVAATPARNAFLLLVKLNFTGLGTKLAAAFAKEPSKLQKLWEGTLGGKMNSLKKAFDTGKNKKRIFGHDNYIGVISTSAAIAAAAPIIAKVGTFLKSVGIDPAELVDIGKKALNEKAKALVTKTLMPRVEQGEVFNEIANEVVNEDNMPMQLQQNNNLPIQTSNAKAASNVMATKNKMLPLYLLGGAALVYLIAKKK
jgi:hypothetical protein